MVTVSMNINAQAPDPPQRPGEKLAVG